MSDNSESVQIWTPKKPLFWFFGSVALLFGLRTALAFITLPPTPAMIASIFTTAIFIVIPFVGLFCGASFNWKPPQAWILLLTGVILHGGAFVFLRQVRVDPLTGLIFQNFMQLGMLFWTLGLGILVAILIREKNMLLPIAIFLAGMDALLILTPFTPQARIAAENPDIIGNIGLRVPEVRVATPGIPQAAIAISDIGFVGPADLFISAMFFAAMFRYGMRAKQTAIWLIPVLIIYLFVVLLTHIPLPALVPIGLTALIVNWKEFKLLKDEKIATWMVSIIAVAMALYGAYAKATYKPPAPQAGSSQLGTGQEPPKPANSPPQSTTDPNR
ncbi:MAG: hypothetical protein ACKVQS_14505 [Fimbriimonadaceae bacterium]